MPIPSSLREEQTNSGSSKLHVDGAVDTSEHSVMLGEPLLLVRLATLLAIVVPLLTASKFELYCLAIVKLLIFSELNKLRSLFYSYFILNYAGVPSLAKL